MKKFLFVLLNIFLLVGCGNNNGENENFTTTEFEKEMIEEDFDSLMEQKNENFLEKEIPVPIINSEDIGKTFIDGSYEYTVLEDGTAMISYYSGEESEVTIPDSLGNYPISQIGTDSFKHNETIQKIVIPGTVKIINENAFSCSNLKEIIIEEGVQRIENEAFNYGSVENITITLPSSLVYMGRYVFSIPYTSRDQILEEDNGIYYLGTIAYCTKENIETINLRENTTGIAGTFIKRDLFLKETTIEKVVIPEGVKFIGEDAFSACRVEQFVLPDSLQEIGAEGIGYFDAFEGYDKLNIKIYGNENSYAYEFANNEGFDFVIAQ